MPKVPTYDNFQVSANTLPAARIAAPEMPDIVGRQAQQLGNAMQQASGAGGQIALDMQQQANQLRLDDAMNRAKEAALRLTYDKDAGYTNLKGINALERPDGKALTDEYGGTLKNEIEAITATLGNDAQRRAFAQQAGGLMASFRGQVTKHEADEFRTYGLSVAEGVQSTALREIGLRWKEPAAVDAAVQRIQAETYRQAQLLGKSAEWQEAAARKLTSNAHKTALLAALEQNDPAYADAYLKRNTDQMDADDILAVRGHITKAVDAKVGLAAAGDVLRQLQPQIAPGNTERAFNILIGTESGGRQFGADGQPLTSSAGAIGVAQVMPGTGPEAAKLAGLPWDEARYRNDKDYNKALGLAYFQKQLQDFGGRLDYAYAAYNAGPGRLQDALKKAERSATLAQNDPAVKAIGWLGFLPKETQAYVAKNMQEYDAGGGQPARPTLQDIDTALRQRPELADNPARYKIARQEAEHLYDQQTKAIKQRDDEAVATAMRGIMQNGGRYSDLPASIRAAVPPKETDNLIGFAQKIAKGDDTTNPRLYDRLSNSPGELASLSDNAFFALRRELSEADFKHFSQQRAKLNGNAVGGSGPGDLNSQAIKNTLDAQLRMWGIDPTPKDDGSADAARIGGLRQFIDQYFYAAQREAGKKFSDAEVAQHLNQLSATNATYRGWFSNSSGPMLGMKIGDLSSTVKDGFKAALKRQGIDNPSDAQIMNAYWMSQVAKK